MTHYLGLKSWATGIAVLAALAGCADAEPDPDPSASPSENSSATSAGTPSPSASTPADQAASDASDVIDSYFDVLDATRQSPDSPLAELKSVATGTELTAQINLVRRERKAGRHQTGATVIASQTVQSVTLDNADPQAGRVPTVVIDVCWDVSGVDVVDAAGESVVSPDRPDLAGARFSVANYSWANDPTGGWRVASSEDLEEKSCDA